MVSRLFLVINLLLHINLANARKIIFFVAYREIVQLNSHPVSSNFFGNFEKFIEKFTNLTLKNSLPQFFAFADVNMLTFACNVCSTSCWRIFNKYFSHFFAPAFRRTETKTVNLQSEDLVAGNNARLNEQSANVENGKLFFV